MKAEFIKIIICLLVAQSAKTTDIIKNKRASMIIHSKHDTASPARNN